MISFLYLLFYRFKIGMFGIIGFPGEYLHGFDLITTGIRTVNAHASILIQNQVPVGIPHFDRNRTLPLAAAVIVVLIAEYAVPCSRESIRITDDTDDDIVETCRKRFSRCFASLLRS